MLITDKMSLRSFEFLFPSLSLIGAFYTGCAVQPVVLKYPNRLVSKYNKNKGLSSLKLYTCKEILLQGAAKYLSAGAL